MTVPSFQFLLFALLVIALYHFSTSMRWRQGVLLAANLAFIASFVDSPTALLPYAGFLLLGGFAISARRNRGAWTVWVCPLLVLIAFVWLKQYLFVPKALFLPRGYLLVGLSYVFFRVTHLVIDGWEAMPRGTGGWVSYLNYTMNFTSLVSGPIQRYEDYRHGEQATKPLTRADLWLAVERVITGFFKVYIVSAVLSMAHGSQLAAFASADTASKIVHGAALTAIYPIYLYFNFSGYTDFVIGVGRLLHIELPENFDHPFRSANFITFWSRWHMSLSNWLKTYVYNPLMLAGMRRLRSPRLEAVLGVGAYFLTFFLVGLWHGQTSEFVFFGFLQGGGVAANKLYQIGMARALGRRGYLQLTKNPTYAMLMRGLTFVWFSFTLLWFWSQWSQLERFAQAMGASGVSLALALMLGVATLTLEGLERLGRWLERHTLWGEPLTDSAYVRLALALEMIAAVGFAAIAINASPTQILYKAF